MAWERFFVSAFEDLYVADMEVLEGLKGITLTDETYHTGSHSLENDASVSNGNAYIPFYQQRKAVRVGAYINYNDALSSDISMFRVRSVDALYENVRRYGLLYDTGDENFIFRQVDHPPSGVDTTVDIETISASSGGFAKAVWNHLGYIAMQGTSADDPGWISVYMNGEQIIKHYIDDWFRPWIDCSWAGAAQNKIPFWAFDDCYVDVSTTVEPDLPVPSPRFGALFPQANGTYQEWNQSGGNRRHEFLSQRPRAKSQQPYLQTELTNQRDTYRFRSWQGLDDWEIQAVIVRARALASEAGTALRLVSSDGVNFDTSSDYYPEIGYTPIWHRFTENPAGDSWGQSLEGYEFGVMS